MSRILLVRLSAMGDVIQSLGAVQALRRACPDDELHYLVQRPFAPLLEGLGLDSIVIHDRKPALLGYARTCRRVRALAPDIAIDLQGNWKSAGLACASGAKMRIGARGSLRREPSSRFLLTHRVCELSDLHPASQAIAMARIVAPQIVPKAARLQATADELEFEMAAVRALGIDPELPFMVLVLTASSDARSWPRAAMLREAADNAVPVLWLAGPAETAMEVPAVPLLRHGSGEVRRLIALGNLVARTGGEVVGPDQGATHVLCAGGARTTAMFGPQDPCRTAPPAAIPALRADAPDCVPCRHRLCHHPDGPVCMQFTRANARLLDPLIGLALASTENSDEDRARG